MSALAKSGRLELADLGCGTGISAQSLALALGSNQPVQWTLVDSHREMLEIARTVFPRAKAILSLAENTPLSAQSLDGILIGSAVHWMDRATLLQECLRLLKPRSPILIFEYQFPTFEKNPALNQWIKTQFNQHWKAPQQKPRGNFEELLRPFSECPALHPIPHSRQKMLISMTLERLAGFLFSQSRYQHFETALHPAEKMDYRAQVICALKGYFSEPEFLADFRLSHQTFQLKEHS